MNYKDLKEYIPSFKNLTTVAVWDTESSTSEVHELQDANKHIQFIAGFKDDGSHPIKLNALRLKNERVIFEGSLQLQLFHPIKGVDIRFTIDGSEPDSITSSSFNGSTMVNGSTVIKARAYKRGWLSSDVGSFHVYKSSYKPDSVILLTNIAPVHRANGAESFFDHKLGLFNANSSVWAKNWAGFTKNDMVLLLEFKKPKMMNSVALNVLIETQRIIFPPALIEIWGGSSNDKLKLLTTIKPKLPTAFARPLIKLIDCKFNRQNISFLKIIAKPVAKLPGWHKSKGRPGLLLIDEIFIN